MAKIPPDPWLTDRLRADAHMLRHERRIEAALLTAMRAWLDTARALLLGPLPFRPETPPTAATTAAAMVADAEFTLDLDAVQASFGTWAAEVADHVEPAIGEAFGDAFGGAQRSATISALPYQERHIRDVHDRLRMWPESAWEDMRPEIQQIVSRGGSIEEAAEQIAGILDISAPTRKLRAEIEAVEAALEDPDLTPARRRELRARRRGLWERHDASLGEWQYYARRIARTEVQGAIEGGTLAAADAVAQATGQRMFKRWLATHDSRVRRTHKIADGQIVELREKFRVGRADLEHPADPRGPAGETIQCRCTMLIMTEAEVLAALDSEDGRRGVQPRSLRRGPDDPAAVDHADELLMREARGETVEWPEKEPTPAVEMTQADLEAVSIDELHARMLDAGERQDWDELERLVSEEDRRTAAAEVKPGTEFKGMSRDQLGAEAARAAEAEDWDLLDRIAAEEERREINAARARARRAAAREAREAQQTATYERLLSEGVDDEDAIAQAFGISVEQQRRTNAISYLRGLGYQGNSLDELVRRWHADEAYQAYLRAEDDTRGQLLKPRWREAGFDPLTLWTATEATARKYASDELQAWWDAHGRVTVAELRAQLLDPVELARIMSARRDYLT